MGTLKTKNALTARLPPFIGIIALACSSERLGAPPPAPVDWASLVVSVPDAGAPIATGKERASAVQYLNELAVPGFGGLCKLLDENVRYAFCGASTAFGVEKVVEAHEVAFGAFDDRIFAARSYLRTDKSQVIEWTMRGTQTRPWFGLPPSQKSVTFDGLTVIWTRDDGLLSELHVYFDVALVKAQLSGLGPKELVAKAQPTLSTSEPTQFDRQGGPLEVGNEGVVRASLDALENNKESSYTSFFSDAFELRTLEETPSVRGVAIARDYFRKMHNAIGQLNTTIENIWGIGPLVAVEYSIDGTLQGPIDWIKPKSNTVVRFNVFDVVELRDGRIERIRRYDNPSLILESR